MILLNLYKATYFKSLIFSKYCSPPKKLGRALKKANARGMIGKFAQLFTTICIIIFLLGTEEKPKRGIVISPPKLSLVLR